LQKLKELENLGIQWESLQEPYFKSVGQFKDVVLSVIATVAKMEREKISERTKAGLKRAAQYGKYPGRPKKDHKIYCKYCDFPKCRIRVKKHHKLCEKHDKHYARLKGIDHDE